jgi:hypothetical protein
VLAVVGVAEQVLRDGMREQGRTLAVVAPLPTPEVRLWDELEHAAGPTWAIAAEAGWAYGLIADLVLAEGARHRPGSQQPSACAPETTFTGAHHARELHLTMWRACPDQRRQSRVGCLAWHAPAGDSNAHHAVAGPSTTT